MIVEAFLTHPQLAGNYGILGTALQSDEIREFLERLRDMLVRRYDEDPHTVVAMVPMRKSGAIRELCLRIGQVTGFEVVADGVQRFARPDAYMSEAAARRVLEDAMLTVDRRELEARLGELIARMAQADERDDDPERRRLILERASIVGTLKALESPVVQTRMAEQRLNGASQRFALAAPPEAAVDVIADSAPLPPDDAPPPDAPGAVTEGEVAAAEVVGADLPWAGDPDDDPWAV